MILAYAACAACEQTSAPADGGPPSAPDGSADLPIAAAARIYARAIGTCVHTSPQLVTIDGVRSVIAIDRTGRLVALDPEGGEPRWELQLPSEPDTEVQLLSTPANVHDRYLVAAWQEIAASSLRARHRVMVVDLRTHEVSDDFEPVEVAARYPRYDGTGDVAFESRWQLQRARLVHRDVSDHELGLVYLPFGNGPSDQPFHGWLFELDLDAWRREGASGALANVLLTTQESDCGPPGNRDPMVCGGGIWNSWGLEVVEGSTADDYSIFFATGNGRVDFDRGAYAHSVMRTARGLAFERRCDESLCAPFDELEPSADCLASCRDLFVSRLMPGDPPLAPENGTCDGATYLECYGVLDADLGANAPVVIDVPEGPQVIVQTGKDGALYVIDAEHMGTLYQRLAVRALCGTAIDTCRAGWAGMFVNRPAVATVDGEVIVIVASLMADSTHYSGVSAFRLAMEEGAPRLRPAWDVPGRSDPDGVIGFREHPGVPIVVDVAGEPYVFVVEVRREMPRPPALLWGVRVRDGYVAVRTPLERSGMRYAWPLLVDDVLVVASCGSDAWTQGSVEAFRLWSR